MTGQLLHSIPVGRLIREMIVKVSEDQRQRVSDLKKPPSRRSKDDTLIGRIARGHREMVKSDLEALSSFPDQEPRRGPKGIADEEYREVANAILDLQRVDAKHVVVRLADEWGWVEETMRTRVKNAVKKGFLVSRGAGAEGYLPGPRLDEVSMTEKEHR